MKYIVPVVIIVLALLGANGIYVVEQGHAAVVTRFGRVQATRIAPGLHFKLPFVDEVLVYDSRAIVTHSEPQGYQTADGENVRVGFFVRWRVADSDAWFAATAGQELEATKSMTPTIRSTLRQQIARHSLAELLAADDGEIDQALQKAVAGDLRQKLGIEIMDVGVERVMPPDDLLASVYKRMTSQAKTRADAIRNTAGAAAAAIRAKGDSADREVLAAAAREAAAIRGEGDAKAASVYATASAKSPQFFRYWSTLDTWRESFGDGNAVVVLDQNSPFMQTIDEGAAAAPPTRRSQ